MKERIGAFIMARQIFDSKIWVEKPDKWFKIWVYIFGNVNFEDNKKWVRGESFFTYAEICGETKATKSEVDHCIRWLKSATMVATRKATRGFHIKVLNYERFQRLDNYKSDTKSDDCGDLKATQKRHRSDTKAKKVKNDKNEKNNTSSANAGDMPKPFNFAEEKTKLISSNRLDLQVIGLFLDVRGTELENSQQLSSFIKRNVRAAALLTGYDKSTIRATMEKLFRTADFKWTLETVSKYIDEEKTNQLTIKREVEDMLRKNT